MVFAGRTALERKTVAEAAAEELELASEVALGVKDERGEFFSTAAADREEATQKGVQNAEGLS